MTIAPFVEPEPSGELIAAVAALAPENPFYTGAYARAMGTLGWRPWVLGLREGPRLVSGCTAFLKAGRLSRRLEIPSLPALPEGSPFWDGLFRACRRAGVTHLEIDTYASPPTSIPPSRHDVRRTPRTEYVIDLTQDDPWRRVRPSHRQRVNRARKAGLVLHRDTSEEAAHAHALLMSASMRRRRERGEAVATEAAVPYTLAFLRAGAGELFQARLDGQVLSSMLVLTGDRGGYDQTSGTSPEGMKLGASHFLIFEAAMRLRAEGKTVFNLGGVAEVNPGLHEFKAGFGPREQSLEAAELALAGRWRRALRGVLGALRVRPS